MKLTARSSLPTYRPQKFLALGGIPFYAGCAVADSPISVTPAYAGPFLCLINSQELTRGSLYPRTAEIKHFYY